MSSPAPQWTQNFRPARFSCLQEGQNISPPPWRPALGSRAIVLSGVLAQEGRASRGGCGPLAPVLSIRGHHTAGWPTVGACVLLVISVAQAGAIPSEFD